MSFKDFVKNGKLVALGIGIVTSIISALITLSTVAGFGWKVHKEIMSDIATLQESNNQTLMKGVSTMLDRKLDTEPARYRIDLNKEKLNHVDTEVKNHEVRLGVVESKLESLVRVQNGH